MARAKRKLGAADLLVPRQSARPRAATGLQSRGRGGLCHENSWRPLVVHSGSIATGVPLKTGIPVITSRTESACSWFTLTPGYLRAVVIPDL